MKTKKFLIYGILGWTLEIIWTSAWNALNGDLKLTGTTYGWMFIIYGLAIYLEKIHEQIINSLFLYFNCFYVRCL